MRADARMHYPYYDPNMGVYGNGTTAQDKFPPLSGNYRFRQIEHQQFAP